MPQYLGVGVVNDCKTRGKYVFCVARLLHYKTRGKHTKTLNYTINYEEKQIVHVLLFLNCVGIEKYYKTRLNHICCELYDFQAFS